jgi:thioredoxin reductase
LAVSGIGIPLLLAAGDVQDKIYRQAITAEHPAAKRQLILKNI